MADLTSIGDIAFLKPIQPCVWLKGVNDDKAIIVMASNRHGVLNALIISRR